MLKMKSDCRSRWWVVVIFAMAMAWVESAVVFYLRTLVNRIEPYQAVPLPVAANLGQAELVREAATLIMLLMVGILAGRSWRARLGYAAVAFGIWDIFYYVFLKVLCGWPHSLFDWDVLFLLPLPWWGPVIAPISIALLMIVWGTLASRQADENPPVREIWRAWGLSFVGAILALYVFIADNLHAVTQGGDAWRRVLPTRFQWPLFCAALGLMAIPLFQLFSARKAVSRALSSRAGDRVSKSKS